MGAFSASSVIGGKSTTTYITRRLSGKPPHALSLFTSYCEEAMAEVVDFQSKLKERVKEEQEGRAASDLTLQMLPIVARAILKCENWVLITLRSPRFCVMRAMSLRGRQSSILGRPSASY